VDTLKDKNRKLDERIAVMQRQLDEQKGQLRILPEFVEKATEERVEVRAEETQFGPSSAWQRSRV
jgi:hypothetical protein